jgi:hypothetical protein
MPVSLAELSDPPLAAKPSLNPCPVPVPEPPTVPPPGFWRFAPPLVGAGFVPMLEGAGVVWVKAPWLGRVKEGFVGAAVGFWRFGAGVWLATVGAGGLGVAANTNQARGFNLALLTLSEGASLILYFACEAIK